MKEMSRRVRKRLKKAARLIIKTVSRTVKVNGNYGDFKSDLWSNGLLGLPAWNAFLSIASHQQGKSATKESSQRISPNIVPVIPPNHSILFRCHLPSAPLS